MQPDAIRVAPGSPVGDRAPMSAASPERLAPPVAPPRLEDHFERGTALALLARGHPYDFVETYALLRTAYGYTSSAANLGLWRAWPGAVDGAVDPGQRLVELLVERALAGSHRSDLLGTLDVLDVGSGLGQAALDLAQRFPAAQVRGANINARQLAFANALAASHGLSARVRHDRVDACGGLVPAFGAGAFDLITAVECVGHFTDPSRFLTDVRALLRPGAVFVCCMNVARGTLPVALRALLRASYGFVPEAVAAWRARCASAGLDVVEELDLTDDVLARGTAQVRERLQLREVREAIPFAARTLVRAQLAVVQRAVTEGALGYAAFVVRRARSA